MSTQNNSQSYPHSGLNIKELLKAYAYILYTARKLMYSCYIEMLAHAVAYLGEGLGGPVPYQSQKSRYSNRAVNKSNKGVTVIREIV